jgi:hypothetical protein
MDKDWSERTLIRSTQLRELAAQVSLNVMADFELSIDDSSTDMVGKGHVGVSDTRNKVKHSMGPAKLDLEAVYWQPRGHQGTKGRNLAIARISVDDMVGVWECVALHCDSIEIMMLRLCNNCAFIYRVQAGNQHPDSVALGEDGGGKLARVSKEKARQEIVATDTTEVGSRHTSRLIDSNGPSIDDLPFTVGLEVLTCSRSNAKQVSG